MATPLCGGKTFTASQFCSGTDILDKCGGENYNPDTHYCHNNTTHTCGNLPHNHLTHLCHTDGELYTCGNKPLNPDAQFCYKDSKIGEYCGAREETFDPDLYKCVDDSKIYLKIPVSHEGEDYEAVLIGTQTWLARNLNYAVSGSKCGDGSSLSDDNTASCDTYGRLYNWATAMALPNNCNTTSCSGQIQSPHQGVCPDGWHLPSDAEWDILVNFAGGEDIAGFKLKAGSGWNSNGSERDDYGFSALPGGGSSSGSFTTVGENGRWWSASENENYGFSAYNRRIYYLTSKVFRDYFSKSNLYSVRCLQD